MKLPLSVADRGVVHAATVNCLCGFHPDDESLQMAVGMMPHITRENPSMIAIMVAVSGLLDANASRDSKQIFAAQTRLRGVLQRHHGLRAIDAFDSLFPEGHGHAVDV